MNQQINTLSNLSLFNQSTFHLAKPTAFDGVAIHALVARCAPLDTNSMYCNLLQASHFADTSILARAKNEVMGFISGYRLPQQPDTLFVWQVAVDSRARGQGLASRMLQQLIQQQNTPLHYIHTTITASNHASWQTFKRLARTLNAPLSSSDYFDREAHFLGAHESELLIQIGPIPTITE